MGREHWATMDIVETSPDDKGGLAVIIVTYNSAEALPALLDSLADGLRGIERFEVVVADNNSHDGSSDLAAAHPLGARVIRMGWNAGYAAAINAAAATVRHGVSLLVLNPDLRLYPDAAKPLVEHLASPGVGVVVPINYKQDGSVDPTLRREPSVLSAWAEAVLGGSLAARVGWGEIVDLSARYDSCGAAEWATGSALLISAQARRIVGEWDESFFLYSEEVDYQRRVREAGLSIIFEPQAKVMHAGGGSGSSPRLFALMTANRIRYYRRHHGRLKAALFASGIAFGQMLRCWRGSIHRAGLGGALRPSGALSQFRATARA